MSGLLSGIWQKVILAAALIGAVVLVLARVFGAGKAAQRFEQLQDTVETQRRIQDADAAGPRTADDVDRRLRDGTF